MKHFSLEELVSAQERSLLDFSHPHVRRGKMKHLDLLTNGLILTPEVEEYLTVMKERTCIEGFTAPIIFEEEFVNKLGVLYFHGFRTMFPRNSQAELILSKEEEAQMDFLYYLDYLGTQDFYLYEGRCNVVCFEEIELFNSEAVKKADIVIFHLRGIGCLMFRKASVESFPFPVQLVVQDTAKELIILENFSKLYADRYVSEKGLEFVGLVAKILHDSGLDVSPSKDRSSISVKLGKEKFEALSETGRVEFASSIELSAKEAKQVVVSISLLEFVNKGFGPHEAPAFASALFLLLKSGSPQLDAILAMIKSIESVSF